MIRKLAKLENLKERRIERNGSLGLSEWRKFSRAPLISHSEVDHLKQIICVCVFESPFHLASPEHNSRELTFGASRENKGERERERTSVAMLNSI